MTKPKAQKIRDALDRSKGKFLSVDFVKKDGTHRHLVGRTGVKKHLKGGRSSFEGHPEYYVLWDAQKKDYRAVNLETVTHLKVGGTDYYFKD